MQGTGEGLGGNWAATRKAKPTRRPATARVPLHKSKRRRHGSKTRPRDKSIGRQRLRREEASRIAKKENALLAPLPASYGITRLVVLPVDPYLVHAYWEVTDKDLEAAKSGIAGDGRDPEAVLRFVETSESPPRPQGTPPTSFDVGVDLTPRNWYVRLWSSGKSYVVQLGLKGPSGRFAALAESAPIQTPRSEPSQEEGCLYMRVSREGDGRERIVVPCAPFEERRPDTGASKPGNSLATPAQDLKDRPGADQGSRGAKHNESPSRASTPVSTTGVSGGGSTAPSSPASPYRDTTCVDLTGEIEAAFVPGTSSRFEAA